MCYADVTQNDDGTFTADCYCGWTDAGHATRESAERAASAHQNATDHAEARVTADIRCDHNA